MRPSISHSPSSRRKPRKSYCRLCSASRAAGSDSGVSINSRTLQGRGTLGPGGEASRVSASAVTCIENEHVPLTQVILCLVQNHGEEVADRDHADDTAPKIGRASCRESVEIGEGEAAGV